MTNTVNDIKVHDIKTIYFDCFDTRLEISDSKKWERVLELAKILDISHLKLRDMLLLQDKSLHDILQQEAPYIFNNEKKLAWVTKAQAAIEKELCSIIFKPWAKTVISELKKRWYQIGMISNIAKSYVPKVLELAPIVFDHTLFSCELWYKKTKNDSRIYEDAQKKSGHKKIEIVMIGDHETNDYDVANAYGIHAIHMDRERKYSKTNRVHTLEQLLDLFPEKL